MSATIKRLLDSSQDFLVPLRMGEGFLPERFEAFCSAITAFCLEWKDRDVIPKTVANIFVDAYTAMVASSYLYPSQASEIQTRADAMNELIRACCE
jgi:hypothetical protein